MTMDTNAPEAIVADAPKSVRVRTPEQKAAQKARRQARDAKRKAPAA